MPNTSFKNTVIRVFNSPISLVSIEEVANLYSNAISYETLFSSSDFDLIEMVTQDRKHIHLMQGGITGITVVLQDLFTNHSLNQRDAAEPQNLHRE